MSELVFFDYDPQRIINEMVADYETLTGRKLYPADPVRLHILFMADVIMHIGAAMNQKAKMNLCRYAIGPYLDAIGEDIYQCERLPAAAAMTTMRFYISEKQQSAINVATGTEVSIGDIVFRTTELASIPPGETYADAKAECTTQGEVGNGYLPGQITTLVKPFLYYERCENLTETNGGTDAETDEAYRERMKISLEQFSVAGPEGAYEYWTKKVSTDIADVKIKSENAGEVDDYVLMKDGEMPSDELKQKIEETLSAKVRRPLTDKVIVKEPGTINYNITLKYFISRENEQSEARIKAQIEEAISEYEAWQKEKMGRDLNNSYLQHLLVQAGAKRAEVTEPVYQAVADTEVAICVVKNVIYGGLEDE